MNTLHIHEMENRISNQALNRSVIGVLFSVEMFISVKFKRYILICTLFTNENNKYVKLQHSNRSAVQTCHVSLMQNEISIELTQILLYSSKSVETKCWKTDMTVVQAETLVILMK